MDNKDLSSISREELIARIRDLEARAEIPYNELHPLHISYKSLVEGVSDFIFILDKGENLVYRNAAWESFFSNVKDRGLGLHYTEYFPVQEKERITAFFSRIFREGLTFRNELVKTQDKNNKTLYFIVSMSPARDEKGEITGIVGIMNEATERILTQRRLKESTKILEEKVKEQIGQAEEYKKLYTLNQDIVNNAPIGIFLMDRSGLMMSENPTLKKIMGYETESRIGFNLLDYQGFINSGMARRFDECLHEKRIIREENVQYTPMSGKGELIIDYVMTPLIDEHGLVNRVVVMVLDTTEQVRITRRARRAEKLSSMGFLAAGVALKLQKPIDKMYMDINFVQSNVDRSSAAREYIESLKSELHGLKNVSEQLLALSQQEEGTGEGADINKIITTHPLDVLVNRLRQNGFEVVLNLPAKSPITRGGRNQLKQVFFDLIENAAEAMPDKGTITVSVETMETTDGSFATITITDQGIGIPEENLKRIFKPFYTTKGENATGLGLMIASTIVENLGGTVGVRSKPGQGTSFKIAIPIDTPSEE